MLTIYFASKKLTSLYNLIEQYLLITNNNAKLTICPTINENNLTFFNNSSTENIIFIIDELDLTNINFINLPKNINIIVINSENKKINLENNLQITVLNLPLDFTKIANIIDATKNHQVKYLYNNKFIYQEKETKLTSLEYKLLTKFITDPKIIFSKKILLEQIWNLNSQIATNTLEIHIYRINKKINEKKAIIIKENDGYKLNEDFFC